MHFSKFAFNSVAAIIVLPKFAILALALCRLSAIAFAIWLKHILFEVHDQFNLSLLWFEQL